MDEASGTYLVVGLGNPEPRYERTRHNVGFMVVGQLVHRWSLGRPRSRFHGRCWTGQAGGRAVCVLAPETYMNRSGLAVAELVAFYKAPLERLLVVLDDMALPLGRLRARPDGSAGGHNGLADVLAAVGSTQVPRLRLGIGLPPVGFNAIDYVLGTFGPLEWPVIEPALARAADAVEDWLAHGLGFVMDRYNRDLTSDQPKQDGKDV